MNMGLVFVLGLTLGARTNPYWRLPAGIETLRDVKVWRGPFERGTLSVFGEDSGEFVMKKGERFQMVTIYGEGECRIRFKRVERDIDSCPWLEGFADPQADIFKVISGHLPKTTSGKTVDPETRNASALSAVPRE